MWWMYGLAGLFLFGYVLTFHQLRQAHQHWQRTGDLNRWNEVASSFPQVGFAKMYGAFPVGARYGKPETPEGAEKEEDA